jgi:hypothetical protein
MTMQRNSSAKYVSDDVCVIALAGIRSVCRDDYYGDNTHFNLKVEYKTTNHRYRYDSEEAREAMYQRLREALCPEPRDGE